MKDDDNRYKDSEDAARRTIAQKGPPSRSRIDWAANDRALAQQLAAKNGPQDHEAANEVLIHPMIEEDAQRL